MLSKKEVQAKYESGASYYDFFVWCYRLLGFHINTYRARAVELLHLKHGDTVIDLGCGTGLNFPLLIEKVGSEGRLIGVDLSPKMLMYARKRIKYFGWKNVELVQSDIATYNFPKGINGILSTGVFGYITEYDRVIKSAAHALVPCGRLVIMDGKKPDHWPLRLFKIFVWLGRPFGLTPDYFNKHPWKSVERYFQETSFEQMYRGVVYISSGKT